MICILMTRPGGKHSTGFWNLPVFNGSPHRPLQDPAVHTKQIQTRRGCPQWTPWKGAQTMLELFSKLFWSIAKSCVLAPVFREIFQIAFKSNFVCIVWSIGFQASRTKREPRAEIGGRGCMQGARPVIRAD